MKKTLFIVTAFVLLLLQGCAYQVMNYSIISSQGNPVKVNDAGRDKSRVVGKGGSIEKATNDALSKAGNGYNALVDGTITMYHYDYFVVWVVKYSIEGTPVKLESINK